MCAKNALSRGKDPEDRSTFMFMTANMFSALTIEAYLNHIGGKVVPGWEIFERSLSVEKKLEVIALHAKFDVDYSRRPFQFLSKIKKFRDVMAHGRTVEVQGVFSGMHDWPTPEWLQMCSLDVSEKWLLAVEDMVKYVHEKTGFGQHPFSVASHGKATT